MNAENGKDMDPYAAVQGQAPEGQPPSGEEQVGSASETAPGGPDPAVRAAELEAEVARLNDRLLRSLAEAENVRRRAERDKEDAIKYAISGFAREVISVGDNLGRALGSVPSEARTNDQALDTLAVGIEMTERNLHAVFERFGIKRIEALGRAFDPNLHEAMFEMEDATRPAGTVIQVVEGGYLINDRLLRPAKVVVTKGGPSASAADSRRDAASGQPPRSAQDAYDKPSAGAGGQFNEEL